MYDTLEVADPGPGFRFTVNHPNDYQLLGAQVNFQPGDVIYVSVRNSFKNSNGMEVPTCTGGGFCDMYFDYSIPQ